MSTHAPEKELLDFPCHFEFKAFGPGEAGNPFPDRVLDAVSSVISVSRQAMRTRPSSGGKYQCVTVIVTLHNRTQLEPVYTAIRKIDDLKYLL